MPYLTSSFGNPSSAHAIGAKARAAVDRARSQVAHLLGADEGEVVFTSCGTESDNWAILAALDIDDQRRHIVTTSVEHDAVRRLCEKLEGRRYSVTWLGVDENGSLDLDELRGSLSPETAVVSVMHANNETGVLFPIREIGAIVKENSNALFHVDGVNAAGKVPIDVKGDHVDLYSISGHKFHAPKGVGALYFRAGLELQPRFIGGGQERGRRAGTEAVHQLVGLGAAAEFVEDLTVTELIRRRRDRLESEILDKIPNSRVNGLQPADFRLPNTSAISFENTNGEAIMAALDREGICVSTGSACASGSHSASHVLTAMNIPYSFTMGSIRFSLSRYTTEEDIEKTLSVLPTIVEKLRAIAA